MIPFLNILNQFTAAGTIASVKPLGSGHINDSYLVTTEPEAARDYVLQRINHKIFTNVGALSNNILTVTRHIANKLAQLAPSYDHFQIIQLIPTAAGKYFVQDEHGDYWRLYDYIRGSKSYDRVENPEAAFEGGKAFGTFQHLTSDIEASSLFEILPDFHHIGMRLAAFSAVVKHDPAGRVKDATDEINFITSRADEMHTILNLGNAGEIPLRVTHNDTKFNNILFDKSNKAISVVDLDTVMPGYILYDFGDAIRTGASTAPEDEPDLSKINIDLDLFEAYANGYLSIASRFLNFAETEHLAFSAKFMTYIIGLRFLTDHLNGDQYFKIKFAGHNLQRARAQFRLLESMEFNFTRMEEIIRKSSSTAENSNSGC